MWQVTLASKKLLKPGYRKAEAHVFRNEIFSNRKKNSEKSQKKGSAAEAFFFRDLAEAFFFVIFPNFFFCSKIFRFETRALKPFGNPAKAIFYSPGLLATLPLAGYVSNPLRVPFLTIPVTIGKWRVLWRTG